MIRIHVERYIRLSRTPMRKDAPRLFVIYWEYEGSYYPAHEWVDFGSVILMWWLLAAIRLLKGSEDEQLKFMDGPFEISVNHKAGSKDVALSLSGIDMVWVVPVIDFVNALIEGARSAVRVSKQMTEGEDDSPWLLQLIDEIKDACAKFCPE